MIPSTCYWMPSKNSNDFLRGAFPFGTDQDTGVSERLGPAQVSTALSGCPEIWISLISVSLNVKLMRINPMPDRVNWSFKLLTCVWLFANPWTVACQAPLSTGYPGQEYWRGLPFSPLADLPHPGIEPRSLHCRQLIYCLSHRGTHYLLSPIILRSTLRIIRVRCLGSHSHHGQSQLRQPRINPKGQRSSQAWWILLPQEPPEVSICQVTPKVPVAKGQAGDSCPGGKFCDVFSVPTILS